MQILTDQIIRLLLAVILGGVIGYERERSHKPAGLRTHILVCLGSTLATIVSADFFISDPARIAAGILTGIGFLGAGTIIAAKDNVKGLTTAASLWVVATVGLGIGIGAYLISIITSLLIFFILSSGKIERKKLR
jgi:putative Mg2+ transporter-C (MgtC) family protein